MPQKLRFQDPYFAAGYEMSLKNIQKLTKGIYQKLAEARACMDRLTTEKAQRLDSGPSAHDPTGSRPEFLQDRRYQKARPLDGGNEIGQVGSVGKNIPFGVLSLLKHAVQLDPRVPHCPHPRSAQGLSFQGPNTSFHT